jgi:nucleoside-diphosphate-sugar epimerase
MMGTDSAEDIIARDIREIVTDTAIPWDKLRNQTVMVTGATGVVGSAAVRALYGCNGILGLNVKIIALGRNKAKAQPLTDIYGAEFISHDIRDPLPDIKKADYIIHCAANAASRDMAGKPVAVAEISLKGMMNIMSFASERDIKGMVFLSSMEAYGYTKPEQEWLTETDLGYIDLYSARSCYPEAKRMCENLSFCFYSQYGVPVKTVRLSQTFGAGTPRDDPRVFAQFARSALAGDDIILHTQGKTLGNFVYISDAVRALFLVLLKGKDGEVYNVANPSAITTIREMAEVVANDIFNGEVGVRVEIPPDSKCLGYPPETARKLSAEKIMGMGWLPRYGLRDMYIKMLESWRD